MSEMDLEKAFTQISLAFRCDQYTLKQRLQAEEHARNLAEENVLLELSRCRETLETLKGLCLDSKRSKIVQKLELSLDILTGTVERISNTAEVLGAVHQEARVSRAVELTVSHVENVRRRLERHEAELEEAKKMIQQQNSCRTIDEPFDPDESDSWRKSFQQNGSRRRVSVTLIPSDVLPLQKTKRESKRRAARGPAVSRSKSFPTCPSPTLSSTSSCSGLNKEDSVSVDDRTLDPDGVSAPVLDSEPALPPAVPEPPVPCKLTTGGKGPLKSGPSFSSTADATRPRHKNKTLSAKKKADKEKKRTTIFRRSSTDGALRRRQSLPRCRWLLMCIFIFLSFITWIVILVD
ncbi:inositol 1,4,5-triphosphate receptor associated 2 isoform X2 [Stigmatopora argus]